MPEDRKRQEEEGVRETLKDRRDGREWKDRQREGENVGETIVTFTSHTHFNDIDAATLFPSLACCTASPSCLCQLSKPFCGPFFTFTFIRIVSGYFPVIIVM